MTNDTTILPEGIMGSQLGNWVIFEPLKVVVKYTGKTWIARLEPLDETCSEYGEGPTAEAGIADLVSTVEAMAEKLFSTLDEKLGEPLLRYKHILAKHSVVNSTNG